MNNLNKPFVTKDLYLTAYLCYRGLTLLDTTDSTDGDKRFILVDREDRESLVDDWISGKGEALICKLYAGKLRMVKRSLYGNEVKR